jgi:enamine deaminase RidA (YjgF/YER057c/UK114 family)
MMGEIVPGREPPRGVTFEEVWAMFQETGRQIKETERMIKETGAEIRKLQKETALQMKETDRRLEKINLQTDRRLEKMGLQTDRRLGELGLRLGDVMEHFMSPKLHEKFEALNFNFNRSSRNHEIKDQNKKRLAEVDVFLENGEYAMAVEVKTRLTSRDVKDHVKRMEILRKVADAHGDKRKYLGAVAGAVVTPEVIAYALKNGFYVIVPSGETVDIEAPDGFKPRIW